MNYKEEVIKSMEMLGQDERVLFLGQTVEYPGSAIFGSIGNVPMEKRIELPIIEDVQMGMAIGLSLEGFIPVNVYPRFDFLICAANQLVNHLDKIEEMSNKNFKPKVIIRTQIGGTNPLYPGVQHCSDYTDAFKLLLKNINVIKLEKAEDVMPAYANALNSNKSSLIIEVGDIYNLEVKKEDLYKKDSDAQIKKNLDVLFVNPGGTKKKVYQELSKDFSAVETPFYAALTAGFIRRKGFSVDILDANAENLDLNETVEKIFEKNPQLVNIVVYGQHPSASTQLMTSISLLCKEIKKKNLEIKIILTGVHPSSLPEKTLIEEECDYVAEGEGFYTVLGLVQKKNLDEIPGLWYRKNLEIKHNSRAENIKNLDEELPDVAWDLLSWGNYKAHNWHCLHDLESRKSYASISTSLGCPFNCKFCVINSVFGKPLYRTWSPEWVLRQIDILAKDYGVKNIKFIDELFVLNPEHFIKIADGLIERNYGVNIWVYARVDTVKEEYLEKLKKAGFNWFCLGIESGDENVRLSVQKGRFKDDDIRNIVKKIQDAGIWVLGNYLVGLDEDNMESMQKTLDLAIELNCEFMNLYCATAYPGSRLYKEVVEKGIKLPEKWQDYAQHSYDFIPLPTKHLTPEQVLKFRDDAFHIYFENPRYLEMVEKKFGLAARKHIEEMTKIILKRRILG